MFKSFVGGAVVLGVFLPAFSSANPKDQLPEFSGSYQLYGQRYCADIRYAPETMYTGTFTFDPEKQKVQEKLYAADANLETIVEHMAFSVTAKTLTIGGVPWTLTFHPDSQGIVRSATLIGVFNDGAGNPCPSQMLLIR